MREPPLKSRKFIAYLVAEITWKILAGLVLFWGKDSIPQQVFIILFAIVVVAGFVEAGFILGQASLDKYTRIAQIASQNGKVFEVTRRSMTVTNGPDTKPTAPPTPSEATQGGLGAALTLY